MLLPTDAVEKVGCLPITSLILSQSFTRLEAEDRFLLITTHSRLSQFSKTFEPIEVTESGM